jgi:hypothetical protein
MSKRNPSPLDTPWADQSELRVQPQLEQALADCGADKLNMHKNTLDILYNNDLEVMIFSFFLRCTRNSQRARADSHAQRNKLRC